jgi:hypothetical protein
MSGRVTRSSLQPKPKTKPQEPILKPDSGATSAIQKRSKRELSATVTSKPEAATKKAEPKTDPGLPLNEVSSTALLKLLSSENLSDRFYEHLRKTWREQGTAR